MVMSIQVVPEGLTQVMTSSDARALVTIKRQKEIPACSHKKSWFNVQLGSC